MSLPPRGAWIEIPCLMAGRKPEGSLPPRGAWIEILANIANGGKPLSLPPRGAWIEILLINPDIPDYVVAPPTGSVD